MMIGINSIDLLDTLKELTDKNLKDLNGYLLGLSDEQLNWKPTVDVWSINEVLAHLNSYANYYHQAILDQIKDTKHDEPIELFTSSTLGKSTWKSVKLGNLKNVKRKLRARKDHNPSIHPELIHADSFSKYAHTQNVLNELLEECKQYNLRRVKIQISIAKIVKLRLGDVLMFVVYHNERHIEQIHKLTKHVHFPN
jgi:uncharacterized damage-inducible protein DinB